ncbi:SCO4225 family membrane protein [Streptomyces sp. NPDC058955]|uniref:SCO4225 family membrane protein n=1 Tax=unclassified Streptomyces TaxID=2593676 RepID=UPI0036657537
MPTASRPRRLLALVSGNWLARGYLALFAVSYAAMFLLPDSVLATAPLLLTAPLSILYVFLPLDLGGGEVAGVAAVAALAVWLPLCALANAAVLGTIGTRAAASAPHRPQRLRALLAPAVDNWLARGYLAVVAVALGFFVVAAFVLPDPGLAGMWPLMATAPFGLLAAAVSAPFEYSSIAWLSPLVFSVGVALSGLANAVLLGRLAHKLQTRTPHPAA